MGSIEKSKLKRNESDNKVNEHQRHKKVGHNSPKKSFSDNVQLLQHTIGNKAVQRILLEETVQTKLEVGAPDSKYEKEADAVADAVAQMPDLQVQRRPEKEEAENLQLKSLAGINMTMVRREHDNNDDDKVEDLQTKPVEDQISGNKNMCCTYIKNKERKRATILPENEEVIQRARGQGQTIEKNARKTMELLFGANFENVNIHTDRHADDTNRQLNSRAFTTGRDIFFKKDEYSPTTDTGKKLLAHELTHGIQNFGKRNPFVSIRQRPTFSQNCADRSVFRESLTSGKEEQELPEKGYSPGKYAGHYKVIEKRTFKGFANDANGHVRYTERTYLIVEAIKGTWLSKITYDLGWGKYYPKEDGYGAYDRTVVYPLSVPYVLYSADRIKPGQRFRVLEPSSEKIWMTTYKMAKIKAKPLLKYSRKWSWRYILGGSVGLGPQGDEYLLEIRNDRMKNSTRFFNYSGFGGGLNISMPTGKTDWESVETDQYIEISDFEGRATYFSAGASYGYSELTVWNPVSIHKTKRPIVLAGWGFGPIGLGITEGRLSMRSGSGF